MKTCATCNASHKNTVERVLRCIGCVAKPSGNSNWRPLVPNEKCSGCVSRRRTSADRDYCARRLADSLSDAAYWREQLRLSETALATAEWDHARLLHTIDSRSRGNNP